MSDVLAVHCSGATMAIGVNVVGSFVPVLSALDDTSEVGFAEDESCRAQAARIRRNHKDTGRRVQTIVGSV